MKNLVESKNFQNYINFVLILLNFCETQPNFTLLFKWLSKFVKFSKIGFNFAAEVENEAIFKKREKFQMKSIVKNRKI